MPFVKSARPFAPPAWLLGMALLFSGCATQKIDWKSRVGSYTFDQAVLELGPPDKEAKLTDGTQVADWLMRSGRTYQTIVTESYYYRGGYYYGGSYPSFAITHQGPDSWLRLLFDANGTLKSWDRYYK